MAGAGGAVAVLGVALIASSAPAPTWCPSTAAARGPQPGSLSVAGHLGPRQLLTDPGWSGQLGWLDRHSFKQSGHRPELVGLMSDTAIAIEIELAPKSKPRLDASLNLHLGWIIRRKTNGVIYVCGDHEGCIASRKPARGPALPKPQHLRIKTLDTIKAQRVAAFETAREAAEPTAA